MEDATMTTRAPTPSAWRSTLLSLVVDVAPSLLIFYVLRAFGISDVLAYLAGSVVPLARLIADRLRGRPFNAISGLILIFLVVSVVLALVTHDVRAVIARGGLIYLALAVAAAVSVPTRSPLMLLLARYFTIRNQPEAAPRFNAVFRHLRGLRAMRMLTALWALAFGVSALACVAFAYTLPVTVSAAATSLIEPIIALIVTVGTVRYLRRSLAPLFLAAATPSSGLSQDPADAANDSNAPITRR
jgi:hypothetical protein